MGGVSINVDEKNEAFSVKTKAGQDNDKFIVVKNNRFDPPINVMSIYGETESRSTKADINERWNRVMTVIYEILNKKEDIVVLGDINKKIGNDELGVKGNHPEILVGGHLVRSLISAGTLLIVNNIDKAKGGPFTRFDPADPDNVKNPASIYA